MDGSSGVFCAELCYIPDISRNCVSYFQFDHVTRDDLICGDGFCLAVARDYTSGRAKRSQRVHGLLCGIILVDTNNDVQSDDSGDETSFDPGLNTETNGHGDNEDLRTFSN